MDITNFVNVLLGGYKLVAIFCYWLHKLVMKCEKNILSPSMPTLQAQKSLKRKGIDVETLWC